MAEQSALMLGALLHDIGKFWQRSGIRRRHESLGAEFLDLPVIRDKIEALVDLQDVQNIISEHHESGVYDMLVRITQISDRLASGERRVLGGGETQTPWETPLKSVFAQIYNQEGGLSKISYPTRKLMLNRETIFPCENVSPDYDGIWQEFLGEAEQLPNGDFEVFFESLFYLLKKYTWCVPSAAYKDHADISLFDHSKVTAAIAWCLYTMRDQLDPVEQFVSNRGGDGEAQVALLVGGDISGIQSFIYSISSEGAAKSLRGRSVFLNLLSDAVVGYAMRRLGNPPICNLLYSSGGHFYFLTSIDQLENIPCVRKEVSEHLFDALVGEIYCGFEAVPIRAIDFQRESGNREGKLNIGDRWAELMGKLGMGKRQKFGDLMLDRFDGFFEPVGTGQVDEVCTVCHIEISPVTRREVGKYTEDNSPVCSLCHSLERLGDQVRRSKYLMTRDIPHRKSQAITWRYSLEGFGRSYEFMHDLESDWDRAYTLDNTEFLSAGAQGFRFVGKAAPIDKDGSVRDFSNLAEASEGIPRWGLLRMDIDNLGKIFSEGLGKQLSLSRITTLSSMISLFFEGYVNTLCEETDLDRLYVIYTGGDDSFIVGSWDAALDFVQKLQMDFRDYTCGNPKITLSAALTLEARKYPLYKAAGRCGDWLDDLAKNHVDEKRDLQKDSFAFLGQPVFWCDFERIEHMKGLIVNLVRSDGGRGLLQRLMSAYKLYDENRKRLSSRLLSRDDMEQLVQNDRWRWRLAYSLAREAERSSSQRKEDLRHLQTMIFDEGFVKFLDIATRWAELATRKQGE